MTIYNPSSISVHEPSPAVKSTAVPSNVTEDLSAREDRLLRLGNGIRDEVVFPRLRAMGVEEADLHPAAMRLVRQVQYGCDNDGTIAAFLGVVRCFPRSHGTVAASEVL